MRLFIYSLEKTYFSGEARSVTLPTVSGEITVLDRHMPLVARLVPGEITFVRMPEEKKETVRFHGGVLEVRPANEVIVLAKEKTAL